MINRKSFWTLLSLAVLAPSQGCNEATFGSNSAGSSSPKGGTTAPTSAQTGAGSLAGCTSGDQVSFSWVGAEKECIVDRKKIYHFDRKTCLNLDTKAFPCDWVSVEAKFKELKLIVTDLISDAKKDGSKLVSCGEISGTNTRRIILQWIKAENLKAVQSCSIGGSQRSPAIVTGCYIQYADSETRPAPQNDEERRKLANECLDRA